MASSVAPPRRVTRCSARPPVRRRGKTLATARRLSPRERRCPQRSLPGLRQKSRRGVFVLRRSRRSQSAITGTTSHARRDQRLTGWRVSPLNTWAFVVALRMRVAPTCALCAVMSLLTVMWRGGYADRALLSLRGGDTACTDDRHCPGQEFDLSHRRPDLRPTGSQRYDRGTCFERRLSSSGTSCGCCDQPSDRALTSRPRICSSANSSPVTSNVRFGRSVPMTPPASPSSFCLALWRGGSC